MKKFGKLLLFIICGFMTFLAFSLPVAADTINAQPMYRLYNPNSGDHHYMTSAAEKNTLVKIGWRYEGVGWRSDEKKAYPFIVYIIQMLKSVHIIIQLA